MRIIMDASLKPGLSTSLLFCGSAKNSRILSATFGPTSGACCNSSSDAAINASIDGIESLVLAHACAGINVEDPRYVEGINSALEAIQNQN